jgi:GntR family transcriptional regulator, transcriptional repressor for pyruvate dehydrogenase complex
VHDIDFHRSIAAASGNPIVAAVVGMVSTLYYDRRRATAEQASLVDMRDAAESHRKIYLAIRAGDAESARRAMNDHLLRAHAHQQRERQKARHRRASAH